MPYHAWKCDPSAISGGVDISKVPWCHLLQKTVSQQGSQKLRQGLVSHEHTAYFSDLFLTHWIMAILSKGCKTDNFESYNFLKLTFTNIRGLCSIFFKCKSFLESNSPDAFALCETNLDDWIDFDNFSLRRYLPFIRKDSITNMHTLAVYVKAVPFARDHL